MEEGEESAILAEDALLNKNMGNQFVQARLAPIFMKNLLTFSVCPPLPPPPLLPYENLFVNHKSDET
jgi:hypothetical protein